MTLVSYVITVYNKQAYLPLVLYALSQQEGAFEKEYIFVDDGSTDASVSILREWEDELPGDVKIIEQSNAGPAKATNVGLHAARGEYIKLVDGDDCLLPWATQSLLQCLQEEQCAYAISYNRSALPAEMYTPEAYQKRVENLRDQAVKSARRLETDPLSLLLRQTDGNPTPWMARRECFLKYGGCAEHIFIQDYILELGLAAQGAACVSDVPLFIMPESDPTRVSANVAQTSHDLNMAVAELFRREPSLVPRYGKEALQRVTSRSWRFAKKQKASFIDKVMCFSLYVMAKVGWYACTVQAIEKTAYPFRRYAQVRY